MENVLIRNILFFIPLTASLIFFAISIKKYLGTQRSSDDMQVWRALLISSVIAVIIGIAQNIAAFVLFGKWFYFTSYIMW